MTRTDRAQRGPSLISKSQIFFCLARPYLVNNHSIIGPSIFLFFPQTFFQLASREGPTKLCKPPNVGNNSESCHMTV